MSMRTKYPMTCVCGHKGALCLRENDQPYSSMWESYSLDNFNGGSHRVEGFADLPSVFAAIRPTCPSCGAKLDAGNFDKS